MNKYIYCPICNKEMMVMRIEHLRSHDYNSREEFLKDYPGFKFNSELHSKHQSRIITEEQKAIMKITGTKNLIKFNKTQYNGKEGIRRRKIRSKEMKKLNDEGKMHQGNLKKFSNGMFRSSWENKLSILLDNKKVDYLYEGISIPYEFENKERTYYPDFYIPEYNLIIEVKPYHLLNEEINQVKKQASINKGYLYEFLSYSQIYKDFENNWNRILERATTIESIS